MHDDDQTRTETDAIADLALAQLQYTTRDHGDGFHTHVLAEGMRLEHEDREKTQPNPRAPRAVVGAHTPDGLIAYATRHVDASTSTLWADVDAAAITVVINDHSIDGRPGWADHRARLQLRRPPEWQAWTELNGKTMSQVALAEFLEEHAREIVEPDGATMIELAQTFHATTKAEFKQAVVLATGDRRLTYEETTTAGAGATRSKDVPAAFVVALAPFEGHDPVRIEARFRYTIRDGNLTLGYRLLHLVDISRDAVRTLVGQVSAGLDLPIIEGTAPEARR